MGVVRGLGHGDGVGGCAGGSDGCDDGFVDVHLIGGRVVSFLGGGADVVIVNLIVNLVGVGIVAVIVLGRGLEDRIGGLVMFFSRSLRE